jgi:hypothetical protein
VTELWTYRLEDFLLFSPRVYWRLFELHNASVWPLQILALLLGSVVLALVLRPRKGSDRLIAAVLAAAWIFVGWSFLMIRYAPINWAVVYVMPAFMLEALLLLFGAVTGHVRFRAGTRPPEVVGLALFIYALFLHPFAAMLFGRPFEAAEIIGIAPDPTAIATLGILLTASSARLRWLLMPVLLAWCLVSAATLLAMDAPDAWIPFAAAGLAILSCIGWRGWRAIAPRRARASTMSSDRQHCDPTTRSR